jgi:tight adherence protein B
MTGSQISVIIFSVSLSAFCFVIAFIVISKLTEKKRLISDRVTKIVPKEKSILVEMRENDPDKQRKKRSLIKNKKFLDLVFNELNRADIKMKPEEFGVLWLVLTFVPSGLAALFIEELLSAVTLAVIGAGLPVLLSKAAKRRERSLLRCNLVTRSSLSATACVPAFLFNRQLKQLLKK